MKTRVGMRSVLLRFLAAVLPCLLLVVLLEGVLRFLPVQSHVSYQPVNGDNPVARYRPNQEFVYSQHWNFQHSTHGRTNAQGFVCDYDYDSENGGPLVAVIGDSYIEARMVPFPQTVQERVRAGLHGCARVYAFAMNGAPLSQYLVFASMARERYHPDALVVTIVSNDFEESFAAFHANPRFHYFEQAEGGRLVPRLAGEYRESPFRELIARSALVRYAYFHLRITDAPRAARRLLRRAPWNIRSDKAGSSPPAQRGRAAASARRDKSEQAAEAFLRLLPSCAGLPESSIVLVIDGHRRSLYGPARGRDAAFEHMRRYMLERAGRRGYEVIDMHPVFERDYQLHGRRFEFAHDAHWNARAHGLAAREVLRSGALESLRTACAAPAG